MSYTIRTTLDLSQVQELQRDEPLAVALVREGRVLGVSRLSLAKVRDLTAIPIQLDFDLPPEEQTEGIELRIGPDAPDRFLAGADMFVSPLSEAVIARLKPGTPLDLEAFRITDAIYRGWWLRCRRYLVRGRLVRRIPLGTRRFCDEPVPGATVELYDVDRLCVWLRKDLIRTAITDSDGYFTLSFRWCCWPWIFSPYDGWIIDSVRWEQLRDLLRQLRRVMPQLPLPIPEPDPPSPIKLVTIFEQIEQLARTSGLGAVGPAPIAIEPGLSIDPRPTPLPGMPFRPPLLPPEGRRVIDQIRQLCPIDTWRRGSDCLPDLLFRATQAVGGVTRVVYEEDYSATRWNVPATPALDVLLLANEQAVSLDVCGPRPPAGDCLWFTGVGAIQIQEIGSLAAGGPLAGYHRRMPPALPPGPDAPFGGVTQINGVFGQGTTNVDYYKLQVAPWGGDPAHLPADAAFVDVPPAYLGSVYKAYLGPDPAHPGFSTPIQVTLGPTAAGGASGLYRSLESVQREYEALHGGAPGPWGWRWTRQDWLATINTSYLPDSLVVFRLIGYTLAGGALVNQRIMRQCTAAGIGGPVELLPLRLDNRPLKAPPSSAPDLTISGIAVNGVAIPNFVCREIELRTGDQVTVSFRVIDPLAHLGSFSLSALYRIGCSHPLTEPPQFTTANTYLEALSAGATRPHWSGGSYTVTVTVGPHNATAACAECGSATSFFQFSGAYDLRLGAWKRTTNGLTTIHYAEANAAIVVRRVD